MTAKDYLVALKVIREIQRKQAYCSGSSQPFLAETLKTIELYCPLDFSKSGGVGVVVAGAVMTALTTIGSYAERAEKSEK